MGSGTRPYHNKNTIKSLIKYKHR